MLMLLLEVQNECGFVQNFTCSYRERGRNAPICFTEVSGAKVEKNLLDRTSFGRLASSVAEDCVLFVVGCTLGDGVFFPPK